LAKRDDLRTGVVVVDEDVDVEADVDAGVDADAGVGVVDSWAAASDNRRFNMSGMAIERHCTG